ncbi:hypothetical protein ACS0TY_012153 [Phlomoides rotata]
MAEGSSTPGTADKPVIVRVKRKAFLSPVDAFWLEIHERPLKRALLDFVKLSLSDDSSSRVEELKTKKILVQHVETVTSSKDTFDVLRSFVPSSSGELKPEEKNEGKRQSLKTVNKQDKLLVKAKQRQEVLSRSARFEQIWRSRKGNKEATEDESIHDMCRLYDVVRVDVEDDTVDVQNEKDKDLDDWKVMAEYLPLLRQYLPSAAEEIESVPDVMSNQDEYVYDFYAIREDVNEMEADSTSLFPLVQVEDEDDFYDGPDDTEYQTDDSNAEDNPLNDYPDEADDEDEEEEEEEEDEDEDEDEDEVTSISSDEESEGESSGRELESGSQLSFDYEDEDSETCDWSE